MKSDTLPFTPPKPVLKAGAIYYADNGRKICFHCAGSTALHTGRDISGQRVLKATVEDAAWFRDQCREHPEYGVPELFACECGKTSYPLEDSK